MKKAVFVLTTMAMLISCAGWIACNHGRPCMRPVGDLSNEPYGATDINTITGNRGLSVAFNQKGTVTVFKWPNPSFYDHVKYMTTTRHDDNLGALDNEGVFTGIWFETNEGEGFAWLRDLESEQAYAGPDSVAVVTTFRDEPLGLTIKQTDFVEPDRDVLWRHYRVVRSKDSPVQKARLTAYLNFSPQVEKYPFMPLRDWCLDEVGKSTIEWEPESDLFVQSRSGKDRSVGRDVSVAIAFGFDGQSSSHQAGYDRRCSARRSPGKKDAYALARNGNLPGAGRARGQVTAGLMKDLEFDGGEAGASLLVSAAGSSEEAVGLVESARGKGYSSALKEVQKTWKARMSKVPLPDTDNERIKEVALRGVIVLYLGYARDSGAGVASISTQPPYGLDWPRDGVYMNIALSAAGFPELSEQRCRFWARWQSKPGNKVPRVPEGNWASNYFADGVPGFPLIWWEIDETGWALWGMMEHYDDSLDRSYLSDVYPAIKLAADFLVDFKDPKTGLHAAAYEDDDPRPRQTIHGAAPCYLGLKSAARAAEIMGDEESRQRWEQRAEELFQAVFENFYDTECGRFVDNAEYKGKCAEDGAGRDAALILWPARMVGPGDERAEQAAEQLWANLEKSFSGERDRGMYEVYALLSLSHYWKGRSDKVELLKRGLEWSATVPVSEIGHFGEVWFLLDGKAVPGEAQPHLWHHALFYLAALETYGPDR